METLRTTPVSASILPVEFYDRDALPAARDLLGMRLVRQINGQRITGIISETEAYCGQEDLACHARSGKTNRNAAMFGPPGHAYVYFTYGMHWCLNCVCGAEGYPAAVLLRAILPVEGVDFMQMRRGAVPRRNLSDGPAKLTQALAVDGHLNQAALTHTLSGLWIESGTPIPQEAVLTSARIGIQNTPEPWRSLPWRFRISPAWLAEHPLFD